MSASIFSNRVNKLQVNLDEKGFQGMLITNLTNVRYLCGFTGSAGTCLITPEKKSFFSDGRYKEQSSKEVKGFECFIDSVPHFEIMTKNDLLPKGLTVAVEGDYLSVNQFARLKELFPAVKWQFTSRVVEDIASIKDESELKALRTAVEITDRVYTEIVPMIKPGVTEKTIALELVIRHRKYGEGESYSPIVGSGPNGALPHMYPTDRQFENGDFIVIDAAAKYAGYHADMTRTVVVGEITGKHRQIYELVRRAQQAGCDSARAGMTCKELDAVTRNIITDAGYGDQYIHSTGHGIGLEIHTLPKVSQLSEDTLVANQVVTIEPGIYLPGWGGVRIEDDIIINDDGCEILNKTGKELVAIV
ncbi:MAG: aminopeptidase P family protein [Candidatus Neomarinimicrobiota bacterium]